MENFTEREKLELIAASFSNPFDGLGICDGPSAFTHPSKKEEILNFIENLSTNSQIVDKVRSKEPLLLSEQKFLEEVFALFGSGPSLVKTRF